MVPTFLKSSNKKTNSQSPSPNCCAKMYATRRRNKTKQINKRSLSNKQTNNKIQSLFQTTFAMEQEEQPSFRRYVEDRRYYEVPARFALHTAHMEVSRSVQLNNSFLISFHRFKKASRKPCVTSYWYPKSFDYFMGSNWPVKSLLMT